MEQEELLTQKCLQDLKTSEELQKTSFAKLNNSESNESQVPIGYKIAAISVSFIVLALEGFIVAILIGILAR